MILSGISLENWGPYAGSHRLVLAPTYYGVEARRVDNDEASNGNGKSMLLETVPFVLGGWTNPERSFGVDGWISDGATSGVVRLDFDDGWWASRERDNKLSKEKEQLVTSSGSRGDEAQREVVERLGLSVDDLFAARFLRQRQAARFVLARPEERMAVVGDWLRLGPLESAEKSAGKDAAVAEKEVERAQRALEVAEAVRKTVGDVALLSEEDQRVGEALEDAKERAEVIGLSERESEGQRREALRAQSAAERFAVVDEEGRKLSAELRDVRGVERALLEETSREKLRVVQAEMTKREEERRSKLQLSRGEFDGKCPVAGIQCPAKKEINSASERNGDLFRKADEAFQAAMGDAQVVMRETEAVVRENRIIAQKQSRLESLREEALRLKPLAELGSPSSEEVASWDTSLLAASEVREEVRRLEVEASRLEGALRAAQAAETGVLRAREELARAERVAQVAREGSAVFRSARRKIAESALGTIERDANVALSRMTSGLSFELSWSRPGSGLSKTCGDCGEPFPRGEKAKACARCKAVRGPSIVEKLEVVLSAQSGANEDICGLFLALSAAKWLSDDRRSAFEVMFLDEVQAHFDASNRRNFARNLPAILGGMGCRQAFVIAHSREAINALPARILVESDGHRSTAKVVT